jgi:hypothetical protein
MELQARSLLRRRVDLDLEGTGGAGVSLQQPADPTLDQASVDRMAGVLQATGQGVEALADALSEALVHRLLLVAPLPRPTQDEALQTVRSGT